MEKKITTYEIPLDLVKLDKSSFHLFVKCHINGEPCHLIIDTGASRTVFAYNLLMDHIKLSDPNEDDIQSSAINANISGSQMGKVRELSIGDLVLKNFSMILIDFEHINKLYHKMVQRNIYGLIGSDLLKKYKAIIDYEKKTLTLKK
jgi:hypothetical protein